MTDTIWPPNFAETTGSKYIALIQSLRSAVRAGELKQGYKLPPVRDLAWQLGITPGTVARAYKLAAEEGLVETAIGRGTFVTGARAAEDIPAPLLNAAAPDMINLRAAQVHNVGQGNIIADALKQLTPENPTSYSLYPTDETEAPAKQAVSEWIGAGRAGRFTPDDIVLTFGAQNATILALQAVLHGPTPIFLTEALSYPGVRHAARLLRAKVIGVDMDEYGIVPEALERLLREHGAQALLTSADAHSPTATRTPLARRQQIVEIARKYRLQIIEDDSHCISWHRRPAYRELAPELGWYISGLTKSVSSALRFGYMIAPHEQADTARHVTQSSYYGLPQPMLDLCTHLLTSGKAEAIRRSIQKTIRTRLETAVNTLGRFDISYLEDLGFIWLKLPRGWRASAFVAACEKHHISIKGADEFAQPDGYSPNAVRIGLTPSIEEASFTRAIETLAALLSKPPLDADI